MKEVTYALVLHEGILIKGLLDQQKNRLINMEKKSLYLSLGEDTPILAQSGSEQEIDEKEKEYKKIIAQVELHHNMHHKLSHITRMWTENTGGGVMVDFLRLTNGTVLAVSDELVSHMQNAADISDEVPSERIMYLSDNF